MVMEGGLRVGQQNADIANTNNFSGSGRAIFPVLDVRTIITFELNNV